MTAGALKVGVDANILGHARSEAQPTSPVTLADELVVENAPSKRAKADGVTSKEGAAFE